MLTVPKSYFLTHGTGVHRERLTASRRASSKAVLARAETNEPGRRVHASVGVARPTEPAMYGYISEHHGYGMTTSSSRTW